ncbi:MAG: heat-inducible transcriptional repressor HrcA [Gammaproteobacteria bacterium]|nr:MAG: heat-inducible transcriptional repressor HrcA [Gammaproteobacteria bacterium]
MSARVRRLAANWTGGCAVPELTERAQFLLKALTERYIREGQPVGSRTLARDAGLRLSPATIRNVMADLEELGLVSSPHTSAGRIPTVQGYRVFVDTLLSVKPLDDALLNELRTNLDADSESRDLVATVSSLLSDATRLAGIVTLPRRKHASLQRVEFLPLSEKKVLAILVISDKEVRNCILRTEQAYSAAELQQYSNFLNQQFAGRDIDDVRGRLLSELRETRETLDRMMATALQMADQVLGQAEQGSDYVLAGQTNLMEFQELCNVATLRHLFEAFNEKRQILHLLDQCVENEGVQIFIGEESGYQMLDECSLVTAPYSVDGQVLGVLGVIGPTRMAYERVIPIVDATARILSAALNSRNKAPY